MKLGECTAKELIESADRECGDLSRRFDLIKEDLSYEDKLVIGAYIGSIWARIAVARGKL